MAGMVGVEVGGGDLCLLPSLPINGAEILKTLLTWVVVVAAVQAEESAGGEGLPRMGVAVVGLELGLGGRGRDNTVFLLKALRLLFRGRLWT